MRVALCLFGIIGSDTGKDGKGVPLDPCIAFEFYHKHLLEVNNIDVYFHTWSIDCATLLEDIYCPVRYKAEKQIIFDTDPVRHRTLSRWYSTKESVDLVVGDYDMIMLSRFDVVFFKDIDFKKYDPRYFYVSHWNDVGNRKNHQRGFLDLWFFGCADVMRSFARLYDYVDNYDFSQHKAAKQHAKKIGADIRYTMYRGEDFEMVRRALFNSKE